MSEDSVCAKCGGPGPFGGRHAWCRSCRVSRLEGRLDEAAYGNAALFLFAPGLKRSLHSQSPEQASQSD